MMGRGVRRAVAARERKRKRRGKWTTSSHWLRLMRMTWRKTTAMERRRRKKLIRFPALAYL